MKRGVLGLVMMAVLFCVSGVQAESEQRDVERGLTVVNPKVRACVQPLGKYDKQLLATAARGIVYLYGFEVHLLEPQPMPKAAYYKPRRRYRAEKLLDYLHTRTQAAQCTLIVGFTSHDISTTKEPYKDWGILGLGEVGGVAAVVSSFRTHKNIARPHTPARRVVKVVNHEIGHVLGLPHIQGEGCLMNDAEGTVRTVDQESGLLCDSTISYIERTHHYSIVRRTVFDWSVIEP